MVSVKALDELTLAESWREVLAGTLLTVAGARGASTYGLVEARLAGALVAGASPAPTHETPRRWAAAGHVGANL